MHQNANALVEQIRCFFVFFMWENFAGIMVIFIIRLLLCRPCINKSVKDYRLPTQVCLASSWLFVFVEGTMCHEFMNEPFFELNNDWHATVHTHTHSWDTSWVGHPVQTGDASSRKKSGNQEKTIPIRNFLFNRRHAQVGIIIKAHGSTISNSVQTETQTYAGKISQQDN